MTNRWFDVKMAMIGIAIDALVLIFLLQAITDKDVGFNSALVGAVVASLGTSALAWILAAWLGIAGLVIAAIISAALVSVFVSMMFSVVFKRSLIIGGIFMAVHIGVNFGLQLMFPT